MLARPDGALLEQAVTIPGTISPSDAATRTWDVVVIGAGIAGSFAAHEAARLGSRVLLVDKRHFPRKKVCGGCLNRVAVDLLHSAGLSENIQSLGASAVNALQLCDGTQSIRVPLPSGIAVSREALDSELLRAAIESHVEFMPDVMAKLGQVTDHTRTVHLRNALQDATVRAKVVVIASGVDGSSLTDSPEWTTRVASSSRMGAGCVIEDDTSHYAPGTIWMVTGAGGYVGIVRVERGHLNIAGAFDRDALRSHGSPAQATISLLTRSGFPVPNELMCAEWQGTVPFTRRTSPVAGNRVFLIGDAAGYAEPFTGEGMAWALISAQSVIPWLHQTLCQEQWSRQIAQGWINEYQQRIGRRQRFCRLFTRLMRSPTLVSWGMSIFSACPWLSRQIVVRVNSRNTKS